MGAMPKKEGESLGSTGRCTESRKLLVMEEGLVLIENSCLGILLRGIIVVEVLKANHL